MRSASDARSSVLIFVAPADGSGGVGDYAEHVIADVGGLFDQVHQIRTHGPGEDTLAEIRAWRRRLRKLERIHAKDDLVVHVELSSGSVGPFWILRASRAKHRTAVVHDSPYPVWWPLRVSGIVAFIKRHWELESWFGRLERFVLKGFLRRLEAGALRGAQTVALTDLGARKITEALGVSPVVVGRHYIPTVAPDDVVPLVERPRAVGLFGHVYGGKGFELLSRLRVELPDDIEVRIAGRGTRALQEMRGVEIVGSVDGQAERDFFNSIRALVLPYNRVVDRIPVFAASGAAARAFSYRTPVVSSDSGTFLEASQESPVLAADGVDSIAATIVELVGDRAHLEQLQSQAEQLVAQRTVVGSLQPLIDVWTGWISPRDAG